MLINEQAGSGGDYLPYAFRQAGLGPLIGKRTWGGLVGIGGYPPLIDGGGVTAPRWGIWFPNGKWEVENRGVAPDIEVEFDPKAVRAGQGPATGEGGRDRAGRVEAVPGQAPDPAAVPELPQAGGRGPGRRGGRAHRPDQPTSPEGERRLIPPTTRSGTASTTTSGTARRRRRTSSSTT